VDYEKTDIVSLFEKQVNSSPDNKAVVFEDTVLTYNSLNEQVNVFADYLMDVCGVGRGDFVPLILDRSEFMIISILAVLKCGAAYVPISSSYPKGRVDSILGQLSAKIIVDSSVEEFYRGELINKVGDGIGVGDPGVLISPGDLAYIIFTSGTTGKPKGVMIEHHSLVNRLRWMIEEYDISSYDIILQKTNYTFDVSVWELILPIIIGSKLVFIKTNDEKDPSYLYKTINKEKITIIHFVPSMLNVFLDTLTMINNNSMPTLRYIFSSGEALSKKALQKTHEVLPNTKLHNLYGPTETTIDVTYFDCNKDELSTIPIGKPVANTTTYILNESLKLLPIGATGELHIGGDQVAKGYLNNPKLTNEKFIDNPYQTKIEKKENYNSIIYKTGDLARYLFNGDIEYIGRADLQVKIHGYRIELGEIETHLQEISDIKQSITTTIGEDNDKQLITYYTSDKELKNTNLITELSKSLPDYMIPQIYVKIDTIPLTFNGKINYEALPEISLLNQERKIILPNNKIEEDIQIALADVLGLDKDNISIDDNFFYLGGDSIKAIKLINYLSKNYSYNISIKDIFLNPSILKLSKLNLKNKRIKINKLEDEILTNEKKLEEIEKKLKILEKLNSIQED
jgi:amino acid adenylation domain-containing protein